MGAAAMYSQNAALESVMLMKFGVENERMQATNFMEDNGVAEAGAWAKGHKVKNF
jgi:hypothetical protein